MIKNFEEFKKDYPNIEYWEKSLNTKEKSPASYKSKQHKNKALDLDSKKIFFSKNDYSDIQYWRLEMIDLS